MLCISSVVIASSDFPGLPPDCWKESRNIHTGSPDSWKLLKKNMKFGHIQEEPKGERNYSPNKGYYFVTNGWRTESEVIVYAEKKQYWKLSFSDNFYPASPNWVSEKILFLRVYWGKIAFEDMLIDVEKESILYSESGEDSYIAYDQYKTGCKTLGKCQCVQKEEYTEEPTMPDAAD